ncbi:MAG TPA: HAD family phosphatase [Vicinamibacteria bacterium]|jgi:HAD superfamily hydrolase (TIGR01509 family)|nr:HAD family phosphatase [Vicinamibacteria bacterium]
MRAVVFDFDGVLVDSEPLHYSALRDCLRPEGIEIDEDEYRREYLAYDDRGSVRIALERHGVPYDPARVEAVAERKARIFDAALAEVSFFPGARELVQALSAAVPLAIASGALRREIEAILRAGGLRGHFASVVGAEDVTQGKPHPEPYLTAAARLGRVAEGLRPEDCLVFEDSVAGIAAARAAGMKVVAVTNSYPRPKLAAAHRIVESLAELQLEELRALFT